VVGEQLLERRAERLGIIDLSLARHAGRERRDAGLADADGAVHADFSCGDAVGLDVESDDVRCGALRKLHGDRR
jgi:hypothetical protein